MDEQKPLILVADDDGDALKILKLILNRAGFVMESAQNGEKALQRARELKPALILLDTMMPTMSGYEALEHLRADPELSKIPVILISAGNPFDMVPGLQISADELLTKPTNVGEMLSLINKRLGRAP
ncbi:MAG: response regulator [Chloroflexi bacterium]|nr:response regulator [Chloroflexota bacterium]